ncbi:hypothetical protein [Streptomyces sp. NPDC093991]|uniref:hypothetical protein n=1 Tax=unclassified Streptomyces TaxID=2593676 RepID=UPI00341D2387
MDRMEVFVALLAVLATALTAWLKPLKTLAFWQLVLVCALSYPVGAALFEALEPAEGAAAWAEWTFLLSVGLLCCVLVTSALKGLGSLRGASADRTADRQDLDA